MILIICIPDIGWVLPGSPKINAVCFFLKSHDHIIWHINKACLSKLVTCLRVHYCYKCPYALAVLWNHLAKEEHFSPFRLLGITSLDIMSVCFPVASFVCLTPESDFLGLGLAICHWFNFGLLNPNKPGFDLPF